MQAQGIGISRFVCSAVQGLSEGAGAIRDASKQTEEAAEEPAEAVGTKKLPQVLLVDHDDSFVHTLGNYFLQVHRVGSVVSW